MESGINADQNFYSRPLSSSPEHHQHHTRVYDPPPLPEFDARSPQLPPKLPFLTTQNLQAATANGYAGPRLSGGDPDDFYREYRGVTQSTNCYNITSPDMAAPISESRPAQSSLRSNGNGTTPKHPSLPQARTALKPSYRSASSPLDNRVLGNAKSTSALNGYSNPGKPSVKDLLKRFDQNNDQDTSAVRKPAPRTVIKDPNASGYMRERGYQARAATQNAASRQAGIVTRDTRTQSPASSRQQRTRFAPEDQHSNNTQSAVPRRPRQNASGSNVQASKSMTNLSPTSPNIPVPQTRRPLFGEVLPIDQGTPNIAYGIPRAATRRTSDSSLHPSWSQHRRSRSDLDVSPSSPTAWYLGVTPTLEDVDTNKPRSSIGHNRNHSDFQDFKVNTMNGVNPSFQTSNPPPITPAVQPPSRLPKPSQRLSNSSDSSSLPSTRANSPFATKTLSNGKLRKPEQRPWSPAGRSMTPTNRERTPRSSPRGKRNAEKSTSNNASLKAYISAPPPKTSPPLRSSRPRLPVSSASTESSRQKAADRSGSPQHIRSGMKIIRNNAEANDVRKRTRPEVPLSKEDFVAKRELIQRAYTRSIHENEQKKIRADNLRRLNERQAARASIASQDTEKSVQAPAEARPEEHRPEEHSTEPKSPPLHINTSFQRPDAVQQNVPVDEDSPTLGMPGTFVDDDEPPASAISNATEIENEPQTEAARLSRMPSRPSGLSSHMEYLDDQLSPEQAFFGMQNLGVEDDNIQIMLDATPVEEVQVESTPTKDAFARDPSPPGAFQEDQPVFTSTVTVASPQEATPAQSRPDSLFESGDEHFSSNDEHHSAEDVTITEFHTQPPEISYPEDHAKSPRIQLPNLHTALAPPSDFGGQDFLNTPTTDMDYESSEGAGQTSSAENFEHTYGSRDGQISPRTFHSHHQSWRTDYSVGTTDDYSEREEYSYPVDDEQKPIPPPKISPVVPPKPEGYSPLPSPRFAAKTHMLPSPSKHQLPPISTGEGLGLGFTGPPAFNGSTSTPVWPDYSPPPPPPPESEEPSPAVRRSPPPASLYNRRPPSSAYQSSLNGHRNPDSRRASDDLYSPRASISTPRSSTQISFDEANNDSKIKLQESTMTEEERQAAEETRKRLFKRMMGIKELIDTESVYIKDMNVVEEIYKGTAEACPKLDPSDIKAIFRNTNEIVDFSTMFLDELKSAASSIYSPRKTRQNKAAGNASPSTDRFSVAATLNEETDDQKDRKTFIGASFGKHLKRMQVIYTDYLKNSEVANSRLSALQNDGAVKVWLSECNLVAKDLTGAWDLDALLVKPVQRITRYQLFLTLIKESTLPDHPDFDALQTARLELGNLLQDIDDLKKRIHMVGKIVGRKRKESDVRTGIAKAFGRRTEKIAANPNRPPDDEAYVKYHEKFGDDYLRLQVILRDAEYQTREATNYVQNNLRLFSSMELFMRLGASSYPEIESKWVHFNMSMRDVGSVGLEDHVAAVRKQVIEPVEKIIALYGPPSLAIKKRNKRRLDYEKSLALKAQGKKIDDKLAELVAQYEALNETLKLELPKLSSLTNTIGQICSTRLLYVQSEWWGIWQAKLSQNLEEGQMATTVQEITDMFHRDFKYSEAKFQELGIINGTFGSGMSTRPSHSTQDDESMRKGRPSNLSSRSRGLSFNSDKSPSLPTPDFAKRHSGQFTFSPIVANTPGLPHFNHQPYSFSNGHSRAGSGSPATPDTANSARHQASMARPSTSRSHTSDTPMRPSNDYNSQYRRESGSTYNSHYVDGPPPSTRPYSGVFHSAMPLPDGPEDSQRSSRASSRDRNVSGGYNVLYLAASLFEFNISATKSEAGYPYLTYQAGEIFDVIGEKGELWLAKNQDDPDDQVGWIWSKHFARLAAD
ncbi:hypothetical protein IFR04_003584 [Cadophora malorum]|uniref:DH domain-containing protein n=1 Tax=Cadophora malorum TaxID=108018 RepID=A0A8H8BTP6_9HELO|nr:hypothetical protein IFR04_003584 [Cadophora malorum]